MIGRDQVDPDDLSGVDVPNADDLAPLVDPTPHDTAGSPPRIDDTGEPLVELRAGPRLALLNLYHRDGWAGTDERVWLREGVATRLAGAAHALPEGFGLAVFDGWRSPATVRTLYEHFYGPGSTLPPGFLADPDDPDVVPPHTTGAAVDVTLTWKGTALALGTVFDDFTDAAHLCSLEHLAPTDRTGPSKALRRLLHDRLGAQGFVGMAEEWWHVSWGDQHWSSVRGRETAPYGPTAPA